MMGILVEVMLLTGRWKTNQGLNQDNNLWWKNLRDNNLWWNNLRDNNLWWNNLQEDQDQRINNLNNNHAHDHNLDRD